MSGPYNYPAAVAVGRAVRVALDELDSQPDDEREVRDCIDAVAAALSRALWREPGDEVRADVLEGFYGSGSGS